MPNAAFWIERLGLEPHPEGGYYRQTYRSAETVSNLPPRYGGPRAFSTAIYFLLEQPQVSALHRIASDEVWHFYQGDPLTVWMISPEGELSTLHLGPQLEAGQVFQGVVPAGYWFAATLAPSGRYALVGCTVAPGFEFADFELGQRERLVRLYPHHAELIHRLTPETGR